MRNSTVDKRSVQEKSRAQDWKYLLLMDLKALQILCRRREIVDAMRVYVEQNGIEMCF